ncbi:MAG: DUF1097 domain-containing protein [Tannerella sp.]|jgi:EamA domain-containing membrane protein RarD|nr:DUF1097 domain-containing protein [Tannerella sp.]
MGNYKKIVSFAAGSAYTALLAFIIVCIDQSIKGYMPVGSENGFTYIAFVAWAVYFFTGTAKDGIRAAIGYVIGITFSIGIVTLSGVFTCMPWFAVPIAVFIVVFIVLYLEKAPWINYIPSMFVASGCFFGIINYVPGAGENLCAAVTVELVYGFLGLLFGWITVAGKGLLTKLFDGK